jgi:hypothetical protein
MGSFDRINRIDRIKNLFLLAGCQPKRLPAFVKFKIPAWNFKYPVNPV